MGYVIEDGEIIFDTDYMEPWTTPRGRVVAGYIRKILIRDVRSTDVVFEPGDGTSYRIIISPQTVVHRIAQAGESGVLLRDHQSGMFDVILRHKTLGTGVATFCTDYPESIDSIRARINEKMDIPNLCTIEALASVVYAVLFYRGRSS